MNRTPYIVHRNLKGKWNSATNILHGKQWNSYLPRLTKAGTPDDVNFNYIFMKLKLSHSSMYEGQGPGSPDIGTDASGRIQKE